MPNSYKMGFSNNHRICISHHSIETFANSQLSPPQSFKKYAFLYQKNTGPLFFIL